MIKPGKKMGAIGLNLSCNYLSKQGFISRGLLLFLFLFIYLFGRAEVHSTNANISKQIVLVANSASGINEWVQWEIKADESLRRRNTQQAICMAQKADSVYRHIHGQPLFSAQRIMAIALKDQGNYPKALICYQTAINCAPDSLNRLNVLFNMTEVELAAGDTISAVNRLESNMPYVVRLPNSGYKGNFCMQYANLLNDVLHDIPRALKWYLKAFHIIDEQNEFQMAGFAATGIARTYQILNRPDSCRWWFGQALRLQQKSGDPLGLADAYSCWAEYALKNGNFQESLNKYKQALIYAQKADYLPILENCLKQLSVVAEKCGEYQSSVSYLKRYNALKDSVNKHKYLEHLSELQVRYSVEQKEQQIEQLRKRIGFFERFPWALLGAGLLVSGAGVTGILLKKKYKKQLHTNGDQPNEEKFKTNAKLKDHSDLWNELLKLLENEKLYRDPEINLSKLAHRLSTNRTTLSETINTCGKKSFNILINQFRIKEACELLGSSSADKLTMEGIGISTGFKSRSAFYAAFTSETGITPSAYRKQQQSVEIPG